MTIARAVRRWAWALAGLLLLALPAQAAGWPNALPGQPLVQAPRVCASGIVPINRRCHVIDFAPLGTFKGRDWFYAFYDTHWADRHGRQDRGFPVIFYLERPATLRLSLWVDDAPGLAGRWALSPPPRPVLIVRPEAIYLGFTLQGLRVADDQRLFRLSGLHWKALQIMRPSFSDQGKLAAATPAGCARTSAWRYDWTSFTLRAPVRRMLGGADCGTIVAALSVRRDRLTLTGARLTR
ncbi:MAG TPA: hypothetical protein VN805_14405 [Caulobacteraceae bacterium]|nr:hypothetical protein [Caulobacteraceae bacterium]